MISITELTERALTESLERHLPPEGSAEYEAVQRKVNEIWKYAGVQRLGASLCVVCGRSMPVSDLVAVGVAIGVKLGWNAVQDAIAERTEMNEIDYLMSDAEMDAVRKEIAGL
jgi:hypothetical protein